MAAEVFYIVRQIDLPPTQQITYTGMGSGGGGGDDPMEARIAKLESDVRHIASDVSGIKSDMRLLLTAFCVAFLFLITAYGVGYSRLEDGMTVAKKEIIDEIRHIPTRSR